MTALEREPAVQKYWQISKVKKKKKCPFASCSQLFLQQVKQGEENT